MIADAIRTLAEGGALGSTPQDRTQSRYFTYPTDREVAAFQNDQHSLYTAEDYAEIFRWYGINERDARRVLSKVFTSVDVL